MDLVKVLSQLRRELADLDAAIASLERFQQDRPRRGRPRKNQLDAHREEPPSSAADAQAGRRDSA